MCGCQLKKGCIREATLFASFSWPSTLGAPKLSSPNSGAQLSVFEVPNGRCTVKKGVHRVFLLLCTVFLASTPCTPPNSYLLNFQFWWKWINFYQNPLLHISRGDGSVVERLQGSEVTAKKNVLGFKLRSVCPGALLLGGQWAPWLVHGYSWSVF